MAINPELVAIGRRWRGAGCGGAGGGRGSGASGSPRCGPPGVRRGGGRGREQGGGRLVVPAELGAPGKAGSARDQPFSLVLSLAGADAERLVVPADQGAPVKAGSERARGSPCERSGGHRGEHDREI